MIDHLSTYATDFDSTKAFYLRIFDVLGYSLQAEMVFEADPDLPGRRVCGFGPAGRAVFWVVETREKATPRHVAFSAPDRATVDRFHAAGVLAGGRDNGNAGLRPIYHADYYGAFLLDPDDNNIESVCHAPE